MSAWCETSRGAADHAADIAEDNARHDEGQRQREGLWALPAQVTGRQ